MQLRVSRRGGIACAVYVLSGLSLAVSLALAPAEPDVASAPTAEVASDTETPPTTDSAAAPAPAPAPPGNDGGVDPQLWRDALTPSVLAGHVAAAGTNVVIVGVDRDSASVDAPAQLVADQLEASGTAGTIRVVRAVDRGDAQSDADIVKAVRKDDTARVVLLRIAMVDGEPRMSILVYRRDGQLVSAVTASPGVPIPRPPDQSVPRALDVEPEDDEPPPPRRAARTERTPRPRTEPSPPSVDHRYRARVGLIVAGAAAVVTSVALIVAGSAVVSDRDARRNRTTAGMVVGIAGIGLMVGGFAIRPTSASQRSAGRRARVRVATHLSNEQVGLQLGGQF